MLFKCKMCGGDLEVMGDSTIAVCEYCGSKQTLPRLSDDRKRNMYDRANHFRRNNAYDKAMSIYENILNEDTTDSEAYWSLVLCKYGIEYVEDPKTNRRMPTCNRTHYTSVLADEDYKAAIRYADDRQREIYEAEAKEIDTIQKNILEISRREEPFDIFICYKETDRTGKRTPDSVIAQDMYYQLVQEGYKVFFSRITLESKLGTVYEPYIFAALNSAKVMVVVSTKREYINAVWVENEWSRFLHMAADNPDKMLIPAYRDMDPYDLPEEFSHLQALDMSKIGFMQDLIHGIKKIIKEDRDNDSSDEETPVRGTTVNVAPLLERVYLFLEDGDWENANVYCEKVLDVEPKNARAYLGKLMAELKVGREEGLPECSEPFDDRKNYQKAIRFADERLKNKLEGYVESIKNRNEQNRLEEVYTSNVSKMYRAKNEMEYKEVAKGFLSISGYKDADTLWSQCQEFAESARKDEILRRATLGEGDLTVLSLKNSLADLESISGWKGADEKAAEYRLKIDEIEAEEERQRLLARKKERRQKLIFRVVVIAAILGVAAVFLWKNVIDPTMKYNAALDCIAEGKYEEGYAALEELGNFKDASEQILLGKYNQALALLAEEKYDEGYSMLQALADFKDAREQISISKYERALACFEAGDYKGAYDVFVNLGAYKDSEQYMADMLNIEPLTPFIGKEVGDTVIYGRYEQDNDLSNGQEFLKWEILEKRDDRALIISKMAIDCQDYDAESAYGADTSWKKSTLRKWLNKEFWDIAFTDSEKANVMNTKLSYASQFEIKKLKSRIFLLSRGEFEQYYQDKNGACPATEYAISQGAYVSTDNKNTMWWMRSYGGKFINSYGKVSEDYKEGMRPAVRPAMWIKL